MKKSVIAVSALFLLNACVWQSMPDWEDLPGKNCTLSTHRRSLMPTTTGADEKSVRLRDSEAEKLRSYLQQFTEKEESSLVTYAPQTVLQGEYFTLNFCTDVVVLNIGKSSRKQYVKKRTAADNELLRILRKRSDSRAMRS